MSHIIEEYAKNLGCKISKPYLNSHFYPILSDKYITFHTNEEKVQSKHYDHWGIVFSLIKDPLKEHGINIVQIGGPKDPRFSSCDEDTRGASYKQMAYIIENSLMHFGIDSLPMHMASFFKKKMVCLFANLYKENAKPIWSDQKDYVLYSPDFSSVKPSFSLSEGNKRINEIKPELVAKSILDYLSIKNNLNDYKTLNIGKHYNNNIIEIVPDFAPSDKLSFSNLINLRCDYTDTPESLNLWLSKRVNLMISRPIDINDIYSNKSNIAGMTIFIDKANFEINYFKALEEMQIKYALICKDLEKISELRFKYFDYTVEEYSPSQKKNLDFTSDLCNNTYYHSNKTLISKNKQYYSKAAWKAGIEKTKEHQKIIDSDDFWEEADHLNIYNHAKNKK